MTRIATGVSERFVLLMTSLFTRADMIHDMIIYMCSCICVHSTVGVDPIDEINREQWEYPHRPGFKHKVAARPSNLRTSDKSVGLSWLVNAFQGRDTA